MKAFENLKYRQIRTLIDVLNGVKEKNVELIRKRHKAASENFDGAKDFLKELKLLRERNGSLSISKAFHVSGNEHLSDDTLKGLLLNELLTTRSSLSNDVKPYLDNFKVARSSFEYKPTTASRVRESGIRNFFIELDLIEHDRASGAYRIKEKHFDSFEAYLNRKKLSPKELAFILKKKDDLGKAAELKVLRYEQERLAGHPELLTKIDHVALDDVMAGYDILSWETEHQKGKAVPRYIEVKAVRKTDSRFYWSRNEVEKAKELAGRYYLYLLPVIGSKVFDMDGLEIIPNPIARVFDNPKNWNRRVETYLFFRTGK